MPLRRNNKTTKPASKRTSKSIESKIIEKEENPISPCYRRLSVLRGCQGDREYYSAQLRVGDLADILTFAQKGVAASDRIQREIKPINVGKISDYVINNRSTYIFPGVTLLMVGDFDFVPALNETCGELCLHEGAELLPLDGQHRLLGLLKALHSDPDIAEESIAASIYKIDDLMARRQAFHDINSAAPVPAGIRRAMNHRSNGTYLVSGVTAQQGNDLRISAFAENCIDHDKSSITGKSTKIFPYKSLHEAIVTSCKNFPNAPIERQVQAARRYWHTVSLYMKDWAISPPQVARDRTIATHSITLAALGRLGALFMLEPEELNEQKITVLEKLALVDWSKDNPDWLEPGGDLCVGVLNAKGKVIASGAAERICDYLIVKLGLPVGKPKTK